MNDDGTRSAATTDVEREMEPQFTSFTRVEGTLIHWAEAGDPTDESPIVALHGLNDCHLTWKHVAGGLARGRRVLMPDLPGHGLSDRPDANYELGWYAHMVAGWMDAIGLARADIIGHSFGGGIAQMLLLECPQHVRRLALVSSGGLGSEIAILLRLAAIPYVVEHWGQPFMGPCTRLALQAARNKIPDDYIAELSRMNTREGSARTFARTVRDIINWRGQRRTFYQRAHELAELPPMAVLWGSRDAIIPTTHAAALSEFVEGIRLILFEGCGHYVHHEQPESFVREVRGFLDDPNAPIARLRNGARVHAHAQTSPDLPETCALSRDHR
jgi:pimeloyl-ACP methyl ester carboxylesterase